METCGFICPACKATHTTAKEAADCHPTATRYPNYNWNTHTWH